MKKVFIKSYGCQMNVYDSERMLNLLEPLGYIKTTDLADANLVILNTCHIREKATEKIYSEIGRINKIKQQRVKLKKDYKLIIAGCVAQAEGEEIILRAPAVDGIIGPQSYHNLPRIISQINNKEKNVIDTNLISNEKFDYLQYDKTGSSTAFVTVQEGCDKFCTFCVVPYTRGAEYSRPVSDIISEIKKYVSSGVKEVTLLGQNVNSYHGLDNNKIERGLDYLINKISDLDGIKRIRYMTSHPTDMTNALIACHKSNDKLMPFIHLPIQSGSNKILEKMNRRYKVDLYLNIIEKLRDARKDIALSSDFIVGFPGETDKEFEETMNLVRKIKFSIAYSFIYSLRPGTPASYLPDHVDNKVKKDRLSTLQSLLKDQQSEYNNNFVGKTLSVLIEKKGRYLNQFVGRSVYNQSVFIESKQNLIGEIANTNVVYTTNFALSGSLVY